MNVRHAVCSAIVAASACIATTAVLGADLPGEPFQTLFAMNIANGATTGNASVTVPDGKRLVIEHVSLYASVPTRSGQNVMAAIRSVVATTEQSHMLAPAVNIGPSASSPSVDLLLASHPVKIYADPNTKLTVGADRTLSKSGQISIRVTISGRLVPL